MKFNDQRRKLFEKSKSVLAEPVAWLLAVTYEPRNDGRSYHDDFERQVKEHQAFLRSEIQNLTSSQGGKAEKIITESAKTLLSSCHAAELLDEANRLRLALERCRGAVRPKSERGPLEFPEAEPERIFGRSGKPIGLWR